LTTAGLLSHSVDLDPAYLEERTYATRRRRHLIDMTALINLMVLLVFLLPARLVLPQLTAVGRPALMVGLLLTGVWVVSKIHPRYAMRGPQPMRWAAIFFLVAWLLSYASAYLRGLPSLEANGADMSLIGIVIFLGTILVIADGIPNRERLDALVRTLVWGAAGMAFIGLVMFVTNIDITAYIKIPGLVLHGDLEGLQARGNGFFRVSSTATHYIEFSTLMAMVLPFAIHAVIFAKTKLIRQNSLIAALMIAASIPVALSRTGVLALMVSMAVMFFAWNWRTRFNVGAMGIFVTISIMFLEPGLLGTIKSLFLNMNNDPSIQGRTDDWDIMMAYFHDRPWLGRGQGTFIPDLYILVDNQWLQMLVGGGLIGVASLILLHVMAIVVAFIALRRSITIEDRHLCACILSIQPTAMVAHMTFDTFGFSSFVALLAVVTGMTGAVWRLTHPSRQVRVNRTAGAPTLR
jgi:polysaccharide biosynthesis protein PslJ